MARNPRRSPLLPLAILAVLLAAGFTVENGAVSWYWEQAPWVAPVLVAAGLGLGTAHFLRRARHEGPRRTG